MRPGIKHAFTIGILMCVTGVSAAGKPAILDGNGVYLPDFSYAGYNNGKSDVPAATGTVINVDAHGAAPDDGVDDSKAVLRALAAASNVKGPVIVRFAAGRYRISDVLRIERSNIVLQGAGSAKGGTVIEFPLPLAQVDTGNSLDELREYLRKLNKRQIEPDANIDSFFSEYSWSAGFLWVQKTGHPAGAVSD